MQFFTPEECFLKRIYHEDKHDIPIQTAQKEIKGSSSSSVYSRHEKKPETLIVFNPPKHLTPEGGKFEINDVVKRKMFDELGKVSNTKEMQAYICNASEHDHSRLFVKSYAIEAANIATEVFGSEKDFPKLFQLSYQWIYDTGASKHFCGEERANKFAEHLQRVKASKVTTASGLVTMDQNISINIDRLGDLIQDVLVLPATPSLMSAGKLTTQAFHSIGRTGTCHVYYLRNLRIC